MCFKGVHFDAIQFRLEFRVEGIKNVVELTELFIFDPGAIEIVTQAMIELKGAVDAFNDEAQGDVGRIHGQGIAAVGALLGGDDTGAGQLAQDLQGEAQGDARSLSQLAGSDAGFFRLHQYINDAHGIVGFVCDSQVTHLFCLRF